MFVAKASDIKNIDCFLCQEKHLTMRDLMLRSAYAIKRALITVCDKGAKIVILAGSGNNGGDGYALASICPEYDVTVLDVFNKGQRSEEGRHYLSSFVSAGGRVIQYSPTDEIKEIIISADCIVDAIFGVGFFGEYPEMLSGVCELLRQSKAKKIAVDIPLGVNADTGEVDGRFSYYADVTVCLTMLKAGLVSQPGRAFCGKVILDNLGADADELSREFNFDIQYLDKALARLLLPKREENSNKSTFGRLAMLTGSDSFRGAAHLTLEGALRGGVGYVYFYGNDGLCTELRLKYPEAIYSSDFELGRNEKSFIEQCSKCTAILIGSGVGTSFELYRLIDRLTETEGAPLILDADAINSISEYSDLSFFKRVKREIILTPHPLELARLMKIRVEDVQSNRMGIAEGFIKEVGEKVTLVLKGSSTLIISRNGLVINSSGSSALAKAGTGDVLAGLTASLVASLTDTHNAATLAVYYHGLAADRLAKKLSAIGVIPSDLPREIAMTIAEDYK